MDPKCQHCQEIRIQTCPGPVQTWPGLAKHVQWLSRKENPSWLFLRRLIFLLSISKKYFISISEELYSIHVSFQDPLLCFPKVKYVPLHKTMEIFWDIVCVFSIMDPTTLGILGLLGNCLNFRSLLAASIERHLGPCGPRCRFINNIKRCLKQTVRKVSTELLWSLSNYSQPSLCCYIQSHAVGHTAVHPFRSHVPSLSEGTAENRVGAAPPPWKRLLWKRNIEKHETTFEPDSQTVAQSSSNGLLMVQWKVSWFIQVGIGSLGPSLRTHTVVFFDPLEIKRLPLPRPHIVEIKAAPRQRLQ